jgi:hypothetical protein
MADPRWFDLFTSTGDVNRFAARYRLAKSFQGIALEGYSSNTSRGYGALLKIVLTYSAFELFREAIGIRQAELSTLLHKYKAEEWGRKIRAADRDDKFYRFIYERVNQPHKVELDNYFRDDPCNISYLASAIRHIFAHGTLTPNANQAEPAAVLEVCRVLYEAMMTIMDREFEERMVTFEKEVYGT